MKEIKSLLKPLDYLIILASVILAFLPSILSWKSLTPDSSRSLIAIVKIEGKKVDEFYLHEDAGHRLELYEADEGQYTVVEQDNHRIRIKEDNSPQQYAVQRSWIEQAGDILINLPHQIIIEIHHEEGAPSADDIILPHG